MHDPGPLKIPTRILLAPGPTLIDPRVYEAMCQPVLGHLDPAFLQILDDVRALLRDLFGTKNHLTFPVSGTGSAGVEAATTNLLEPGDRALVTTAGFFGQRMVTMAEHTGAEVIAVGSEPGRAVDPADLKKAAGGKKVKVVGVVHVDTSTGVQHDLAAFREVADSLGALLVVDGVATIGGVPVKVDEDRIDACVTASQKCLSAPPGLAPLTAGPRAEEAIRARKKPPAAWYLDLGQIVHYWDERRYHHTAPISMIYALREALRIVAEEGLENRWARHRRVHDALVAGLEALGLEMLAEPSERAVTVVAVRIPEGIEDAAVRGRLLDEFGIEIAGGVGELKGRLWRVGVMGHSATGANMTALLRALATCLADAGRSADAGDAVSAAERVLAG